MLNDLGKVHYLMGNYSGSASVHAHQHTIARTIFDHFGEMRAFYGQGMALRALGRQSDAHDMFRRYMESAEECGESKDVAVASGRMGETLREMGKMHDSFACFRKQIGKLREILVENPADKAAVASLAAAFGNLGKVYRKWGKLPLCYNAVSKELKLLNGLGNRKSACASLYNLAGVNVEMKLGVTLGALPKYAWFGSGNGDGDDPDDKGWSSYVWESGGWGPQWRLFNRCRRRDGIGKAEHVIDETIQMLQKVIDDEAAGEHYVWKRLD